VQTIEPLLAKHLFFQGLAPEHLKLIVGCSTNVIFDPDQFLFREGEDANTFYVIRSGRVQVETFSPKHGPITIQTAGEGEVLGWSWLIPPYHWRFDAKATDQVRVIAIDGKCLREKCEDDHNLGYELMRRFALIIAERLEATRLQLLDVYGK
jgi:CRP/FNR family transcriptional regulator, cyclic AMP receptor protein